MNPAQTRPSTQPIGLSLPEIHGSVQVPPHGPTWRRWLAVTGPAVMVAVGYMDPGNWATDIAGGSRYEYRLLWVLLMSNAMAILLQSLSARLGIVRRRDLAQASREAYPTAVNLSLYALAEIAIAACDLAEVLGSAIALNLLFGLPLLAGVLVTTLDVIILLTLSRFGVRRLEAVVFSLVGMIGLAFLVEIILARPEWGRMAGGFVPAFPDAGALYIAIGILGATVMPHNLYLHSALVQTRSFAGGPEETRRSIRLNTIDSAFALNLAFFVNAAILVMAAAVFYRSGHHEVAEIQEAHRLLEPLVGVSAASFVFALALLASGQSSTVTGTLAGQIVMEGYLNLRIRPWLRRLLTRLIAVIPAVLVIAIAGEQATGKLLVLSQVILSLQLPFATIPLIHFVSDRAAMGQHAIRGVIRPLAWIVVLVIVALNAGLVAQIAGGWMALPGTAGLVARVVVIPLGAVIAALLLYVAFQPWLASAFGRRPLRPAEAATGIHREMESPPFALEHPGPLTRVAIALDFSGREERLLQQALRFLQPGKPTIGLLHVVESPSARAFGREVLDEETEEDAARLERIARALRELGYTVTTGLGAGDPAKELARLAENFGAELVILGGHGHRGLSDMIYGTTADALRHRVKISVLVIPLGP